MSKLKQRYLKEPKSFFPIMGKPERRHLKKLSEQINDYCLEKEVFSIDDLYQDFGRPSEISNTYFSNIDINDFVKRIQLSKWLKRGIAIFLLIALIVSTVTVHIKFLNANLFISKKLKLQIKYGGIINMKNFTKSVTISCNSNGIVS